MADLEDVLTELRALRRERAAPKALMSFRSAATYLGIDRKTTLRTLVADGRIRTVLVNGRVKIPFVEVQRVATEGTEAAPVRRVAAPRVVKADPGVADRIRAFKAKLGSS